MNEPLNNKEFDNANFDAYVGNFDNDKFVRGTYLSKISDDYYLYHGNFDGEGKKLMIMPFSTHQNMIEFCMAKLKRIILLVLMSPSLSQILEKLKILYIAPLTRQGAWII